MSLVNGDELSIGQSTVSLFKSIGVANSPSLLVNFVSETGQRVPKEIAKVLPKLPNMGNTSSSNFTMPKELIAKFQTADVTTIFSVIKDFVNSIFAKLQGTMANNPFINFDQIKASYLSSLNNTRLLIEDTFQSTLNKGYANLFTATAIIACVGFILSLMIKERKQKL